MQMSLNDEIVHSFRCGRVLKDHRGQINSIDFHRTHDLLVTASADDTLQLYDTAHARHICTIPSHKYGAQNVVWTHAPDRVVFASDKGEDHALRYLQIVAQGGGAKFLTYFRGHSARVTKVAFNPKNDTFMSAGQDKEVRLWDLRTQQCQAVLQTPCQPTMALDQQGLVFAVGLDNGIIKLYDASHYDQGPFETFVVQELCNSPVPFSHLSFSNDGKLLLAVAEGKVFVLDAFTGAVKRTFANGVTEAGASPESSISYDGQYVLSGCEDKSVRVWSVASGAQVASWTGHPGIPYCVKWAPRRLLAASACGAVCLWIPSREALQQPIQRQHMQLQGQQYHPGMQPQY